MMNNNIIPKSELKILGEVFQKVDEIVKNHQNTPLTMDSVMNASELEQLQTLVYMDMFKDFIKAIGCLKGLLELNDEEFTKMLTDDGKRTIGEAKHMMMLEMMIEHLTEESPRG